jgi:CMP-N-acetylneuraminate monooxygenase
MFKNIGELKNLELKKEKQLIPLDKIKNGINCLDDFIVFKKGNDIKVYDRICDHNGGKIISRENKHVCPIHNWVFDPKNGAYKNGIKKKEKNYKIQKNEIIIEDTQKTPEITKLNVESKVKIRFFNHAFLIVETENFKFATDPWSFGPAFNSGWWLKFKTKSDWETELNSCSFIYISHNHPDHLHPLTLSKVKKNMPIVVPNFTTNSTGIYIESLGFKKIHYLDLNKEYNLEKTNLVLSLLKSGDFREDSGIYFSIGSFSGLFSVDASMINFGRLPKVDLLAAAFAGGASGYPLIYDNIGKKEKKLIAERNKIFIFQKKKEMLKKTEAKYFLPYAGFFKSTLKRDNEIEIINPKNSIMDYDSLCKKLNINLLNVEKNDEYYFENKKLTHQQVNPSKSLNDISEEKYLEYYKKNYKKIDEEYIKNYFVDSMFQDNLILFVSLVDDNFNNSKLDFKIDFTNKNIRYLKIKKFEVSKLKSNKKNKILHLKIRKESFLNTIYNKSPWEDLAIGFQCRAKRFPNIYNAKFWYHFTNKYITDKNIRFSSDCSNCESITTFFDNQMYENKIEKN